MTPFVADRGNSQRIPLISFCQRHNRARHGGGKQQGAPLSRRCIQNFLQILAKAHVQHFVRFIEHGDLEQGQIERAAFEMIPQAARRTNHDVRALSQAAAFL